MKSHVTPFGSVHIDTPTALFESLTRQFRNTVSSRNYPPGIALTGGSSPKAYYEWLTQDTSRLPEAKDGIIFTVSDERCVPIESEESNFGNARRMFFDKYDVIHEHLFPWDTQREPAQAALWYSQLWELSFGADKAYDLCMLGMGDDCHTASLFPGSPLLCSQIDSGPLFSAVEIPGKGSRLTITPRGLSLSDQIVVLVMGAGKEGALARVFNDRETPVEEAPVKLLQAFADKVTWLIDPDAAGSVDFS